MSLLCNLKARKRLYIREQYFFFVQSFSLKGVYMKKRKVFKATIAESLLKKGFPILEVKMNYNNPKLKVFLFEDTPEFELELNKLVALAKQ